MAELKPLSLGVLLRRLHREHEREGKIFDLPARNFFHGDPALDTSVLFHGHRAATPAGPAAGPQDQLVQNIVLSWLGGGRIIELKTVQIMDRLKIPRPCIDMTNVGYNVEWSQELTLAASLREYVAASMALEILADANVLGRESDRAKGETILDMSVGYDLEGIRSKPVRGWIETMMDARALVDELRREIPDELARYRDFPFRTRLSDSITLSTFHGCPADEIERITEFLLREVGVHMTVKLNPTLLGKPAVDHLLKDRLGYEEIDAPQDAFDKDLQFDQCLEICDRLGGVARSLGRSLAVKFSNTLVIRNHLDFFPKSEALMYLSGAPLHVLTLNLVRKYREAIGHRIPISFSAGIDQHNFADAVALGFTPVTVCTDLLRPGGYARFHKYVENLEARMRALGVATIGDFVLAAEGNGAEAVRRAFAWAREACGPAAGEGAAAARAALDEIEREATAALGAERKAVGALLARAPSRLDARLGRAAGAPELAALRERVAGLYDETVAIAGALNTGPIVGRVSADPRYAAAKNRAVPKKIGSRLVLFDCVSCNKCVPVCPNDANFRYDVEPVEAEYAEIVVTARGPAVIPRGLFRVERGSQWATYHDFCNECGNCDVFCPEEGGPFVEKPRFFSCEETYKAVPAYDGFVVERRDGVWAIRGRVRGREYALRVRDEAPTAVFGDGVLEADLDLESGRPAAVHVAPDAAVGHSLSLERFFLLRTLLRGVLDPRRANYVNAATS
jgi:putative selenate reductase